MVNAQLCLIFPQSTKGAVVSDSMAVEQEHHASCYTFNCNGGSDRLGCAPTMLRVCFEM